MRTATLLPLLVVLASALPRAIAGPGDLRPGETDRPWAGALPDPDQDGGEYILDFIGTRIVDERTGAPVPGAELLRYAEWEMGDATRHSPLYGRGVSDQRGYASVPSLDWIVDAHWVVKAEGYAPAYEYGYWPPARMALRAGIDMTFRLVDAMGRPAAGARVELIEGCGHSPALRRAVSDERGLVTLRDVDPESGQLWIEHAGSQAEYIDLDVVRSRGRRMAELVLSVGWIAEGRIVDLAGDPLPDVVVRSTQAHRGPAVVTDRDGHFRMEGVAPQEQLSLYHPGPVEDSGLPGWVWWADRVPFTAVLGPASLGAVPDDPQADAATLVVTAVDAADGGVVDDLDLEFVDLSCGARLEGWIGESDDDGDEGPSCETELRPARYRIAPASAFGERTFDPVEVDLAAGETAEIILRTRVQPRLHIEGSWTGGDTLTLVVDGEESECGDADPAWEWDPPVPADGDLVLCLEPDEGPVSIFPVGPAVDGVRTVRVQPEESRVLHITRPPGDAVLLDRGWPCHLVEAEDGTFHTWATGPLTLRLEYEDGQWEVPVRVPEKPGGVVLVDPDRDGRRIGDVGDTVIVATSSGGPLPGPVHYEVETRNMSMSSTSRDGRIDATEGAVAILELDGYRRVTLGPLPRGEVPVVYGPCALEVFVTAEEEGPVTAVVCIDGETYRTDDEGRLLVRGFLPGPHEILACEVDTNEGGRILAIRLDERDTPRTLEITLHQWEDEE